MLERRRATCARSLGAFDDGFSDTLLGFTATTVRGDGMGLDEVSDAIVYDKSMLWKMTSSVDITQ